MDSPPRDILPRVLLVDHRPRHLEVLEALLRGEDRQLLTAPSGREAVRLALDHDCAVILLQMQLEDMNPLYVTRALHAREATRTVPVIFVTAKQPKPSDELQGYGAGAVDFLLEPLNAKITRAKVQVFLELWRQRRELARSNRDLREFATVVAHDLKNPMTSIRGFAEVLEQALGPELSSLTSRSLARIREGIDLQQGLLEGLLTWSRVDIQGQELRRVDAAAVAKRVVGALDALINEAQAEVVVRKLPAVIADEAQLGQLLQNLVANAIKYREPERPCHVTVEARAALGEVEFRVRDNGVGIEEAALSRVFGMFQRLRKTRHVAGQGVGLAVCKRIVERHGGAIWVRSRLGEGTDVHFRLRAAL